MTLFRFTILTICFFLQIISSHAQQRLKISPDMVINVVARGDAWMLFDDQPRGGSEPCQIPRTSNPWEVYDGIWNGQDFFYPLSVVVDLGQSTTLNQICLRNAGGNSDRTLVFTGGDNPASWISLFEHQGQECHNTPIITRYLRFTFQSRNSQIREIELYGPQQIPIICPPSITTCRTVSDCNCDKPTMDRFIGSNTNLDIPVEKANAVGFVRNYQHSFFNSGYHDINQTKYPEHQFAFSPTKREEYDHDHFYEGLYDLGLEVTSDVHKSPPNLVTFGYKNGDYNYTASNAVQEGLISSEFNFVKVIERRPFDEQLYPIYLDQELDDPAAYLEYADMIYQIGARYGYPGTLNNQKVESSNIKRSGTGWVQYLENWNEPDKWWHYFLVQNEPYLDPYVERRLGYFSPNEYAAMSSAAYDGHGSNNGVENIVRDRYLGVIPQGASPVSLQNSNANMKYVMAGLTEINLDYVQAVKFWFETHRPDIGFPFDAINFHHYSHNANLTGGQQLYGISPEEDGLRDRVRAAVDFRDRYLPGVEVWLSEFGYDTHPRSIQSPDCARYCGNCDSPDCFDKMRELQAQWVVRGFLEIAAGGADRAMVFSMRDDGPESISSIYNSAGMNTWQGENEDEFDPKPSWFYTSTLKHNLEGLTYDPGFTHADPNVRLYRFVDDCNNPTRTAYAIWSPTSNHSSDQTVFANYALPFNTSNATVVQFLDGDVDGFHTPMNGQRTVNVSERPKLIIVGEDKDEFIGCACNYQNLTVSGDGNTAALIDEQAAAGDLYCGEGKLMNSSWNPGAGQSAIIDLGRQQTINHLFLSSEGLQRGEVDIFIGTVGNWQKIYTWQVKNPRPYKWKTYADVNLQSRYIRLVPKTAGITIDEVKVCGEAAIVNLPTCDDGIQNGNETGVDCGGPDCEPCNSTGCVIPLQPSMFFQPDGQSAADSGFAGSLADEQSIIGDPSLGNGLEANVPWQNPWSDQQQAYLDLGQEYDIDGIHLYDGYGTGIFEVAPGKPADNQAPIIRFNADAWPPTWRSFEDVQQKVRTRYLTFTRVDAGAKINEVSICGSPAGSITPTCSDGIKNGNEIGVDCGGSCPPCISCSDGIQNGSETDIDCGGTDCPPCISCTDGLQNGNETGIDCGGSDCPPCETGQADCPIHITPNMFYNEFGQQVTEANFGGSLADEQSLIGDPLNNSGNDVSTPWQYPWGDGVKVYLDLGQPYRLDEIALFDGFGTGQFRVYAGLPGSSTTPLVDINLDFWPPAWRNFSLNVITQHLTFERVDGGAKVNEIALCGAPIGAARQSTSDQVSASTFAPCTINLSPNPTSTILQIDTNSHNNDQWLIYNANGQLIQSGVIDDVASKRLDVSDLVSGVYYLRLLRSDDCGIGLNKFVVID